MTTIWRVDAARSVYDGCRGVIVKRSTTGVQLALEDPPSGWPSRVWFDYYEIVETAPDG